MKERNNIDRNKTNLWSCYITGIEYLFLKSSAKIVSIFLFLFLQNFYLSLKHLSARFMHFEYSSTYFLGGKKIISMFFGNTRAVDSSFWWDMYLLVFLTFFCFLGVDENQLSSPDFKILRNSFNSSNLHSNS